MISHDLRQSYNRRWQPGGHFEARRRAGRRGPRQIRPSSSNPKLVRSIWRVELRVTSAPYVLATRRDLINVIEQVGGICVDAESTGTRQFVLAVPTR